MKILKVLTIKTVLDYDAEHVVTIEIPDYRSIFRLNIYYEKDNCVICLN
jgi:hypothetical protein